MTFNLITEICEVNIYLFLFCFYSFTCKNLFDDEGKSQRVGRHFVIK